MTSRSRVRLEGPITTSVGFKLNGNPQGTPRDIVNKEISETMDDIVTPGFHKRSNAGEVIINPCTYVKVTEKTVGNGHQKWTRTNNHQYEYGPGPGLTEYQRQRIPGYVMGYPSPPQPPSTLWDAAKLKALGNIDRSPYSFAEDIAEMRETLRFLKDPLNSLRNLSDELRTSYYNTLKRKKYLNRTQALADVWLQYQFAFSPLVRSANDLLASFSDSISVPKRRTARGFANFEDSTWDSLDALGHRSEGTATTVSEVRAGILYEVANPLKGWRDKYGLRFKDIPETLWAIVPLSFMVDRVFNISSSLRGIVAFLDPNVEILGAWVTEKNTQTQTLTYNGYYGSIVKSIDLMVPDTQVKENFAYVREVWEPTINDFIPPVEVQGLVDTSTKLADLAALVLQRLRVSSL